MKIILLLLVSIHTLADAPVIQPESFFKGQKFVWKTTVESNNTIQQTMNEFKVSDTHGDKSVLDWSITYSNGQTIQMIKTRFKVEDCIRSLSGDNSDWIEFFQAYNGEWILLNSDPFSHYFNCNKKEIDRPTFVGTQRGEVQSKFGLITAARRVYVDYVTKEEFYGPWFSDLGNPNLAPGIAFFYKFKRDNTIVTRELINIK